MASGKYSRTDSRASSSFCSATTITVLVALCLVGVWMITSSTKFREEVLSLDTESNMSDETSPASFKYASSGRTETSVNEDPTKGYDNGNNENNSNSSDGSDGEDNKDSGTAEENKDAEKGDGTSDEVGGQENDGVENNDESNENKIGSQTNEIEEEVDQSSKEGKEENQLKDKGENEIFPLGTQSELLNETNSENGAWSTQAVESKNEKDVQDSSSSKGQNVEFSWKLCDVKAGTDYIPCLDNEAAIWKLRSTKHYEHRERHCPDNAPTCLVPLPDGYKPPIKWPMSREKVLTYQ